MQGRLNRGEENIPRENGKGSQKEDESDSQSYLVSTFNRMNEEDQAQRKHSNDNVLPSGLNHNHYDDEDQMMTEENQGNKGISEEINDRQGGVQYEEDSEMI